MRQFIEDAQVVFNSVRSPIYKSDSLSFHQKVFSELEDYLQANGLQYSEQTVKKWLAQQKQFSEKEAAYRCTKCITRLIDVINTGKVSRNHLSPERIRIAGDNKKLLDDYIEWIRKNCSPSTISSHRWAVSLFLRFAQSQDLDVKNDCSIVLFEDFIDFLKDLDIQPHQVSFSLVKFIKYLEYQKMAEADLHWFFHDHSRVKRLNNYSESFLSAFDHYRKLPDSLSLSVFRDVVYKTVSYLEDDRYRQAVIVTSKRTFRLFYLFLSRADLPYHPLIAEFWIVESRDIFLDAWYMARRALDILAAIATDSAIEKRKTSHTKYNIPEWAADNFQSFIELKIKERFDKSTVNMFRVCIGRFVVYLDNAGIRSYKDITPDIIHAFNRDEKYGTNYSKNAYNCRIRRFLEYLEVNRITSQPGLQYSLARASHSSERFVDVLSAEEIETLEKYCADASTPIELRNSAMILLSLKMGLRLSDVTNLELDDIDWKEKSIRFTQVKTHKEMCLPMPVEVGNAIYAYLTDGRPRGIESAKVFVSSSRPYMPLSGEVLRLGLRRALPHRNIRKSGFHVLRRTFSSITLNSGNTTAAVAELLGHSGSENVHKYLSMDATHMKQCPLSFDEAGIEGVIYVG